MMNIDPETQLAFVNFDKDSKKWVLSLLNRAIVVDANGNIKEGFAISVLLILWNYSNKINFLFCNHPKIFSNRCQLKDDSRVQ